MLGITYRIESEIDNAFPYLLKLNNELEHLYNQQANKITLTKRFKTIFKNSSNIIEKRNLIKSKTYTKDGYYFKLRLYKIYNASNKNHILHYEFYVNIKYVNEIINKQFYKKITNRSEAIVYFENMLGVFKTLKRRDLMEKLFKEKEEELKKLKK